MSVRGTFEMNLLVCDRLKVKVFIKTAKLETPAAVHGCTRLFISDVTEVVMYRIKKELRPIQFQKVT